MAVVKVPSGSTPGVVYEVDTTMETCTCPGYSFRRQCKHLQLVEAAPEKFSPTGVKAVKKPGLFTIGHSNFAIGEFLERVAAFDLGIVVDVRSTPFSRRQFWFNRPNIRDSLRQNGIDYFWAGKELGGLGDVSINSPGFVQRMKKVVEMSKSFRVALMCSEGNPVECHRAMKLTAYLHGLGEHAIHILRDGQMEHSQIVEAGQSADWFYAGLGPGGGK